MEVAFIGALSSAFLPKLWELIAKSLDTKGEVEAGIESIKAELKTVSEYIRKPKLQRISTSPEVSEVISRACELAQEIEYNICRFVYQPRPPAKGTPPLKYKVFADKIKDLKEKLKEIIPELKRLVSKLKSTTSAKEPQDPQFGEEDPDDFGMGDPRNDLQELLKPTPPQSDTKMKLKVISIVGFGGSGKTRLAKQVYEEASNQFDQKAWVHVGLEWNVEEVRDEILKQLGNGAGAPTSNTGVQHVGNGAGASTEGLKSCLRKRYLIVIDDVRKVEDWVTLEKEFPRSDLGSRIIVTTTSQSVAARCSYLNGHVYKMSTLSGKDSVDLFLNAGIGKCSGLVQKELSTLIKTCDGLPLAIIESAESLKGKMVEEIECKKVIRNLCVPEERRNGTLTRMQWVLMNKYSGLTSYGARACLLYLHMFPVDNPIKLKSVVRRWIVEELVAKIPKWSDLQAASCHLKDLIDGIIIRPMQVSSNATVKSCRLPGTMHEFISVESMSQNFVTFSYYEHKSAKPEFVRRLSLHGGPTQYSYCIEDVDLYLLRTLAVSGKACKDVLDFSLYKILRVLDLKEWVWDNNELNKTKVGEKVIAICNLVMLKYLGLPGSIGSVPREIEYLKVLQTLDVGGEEIVEVYGEVITHPVLKHLLGKFCLYAHDSYDKWIPEKSALEIFSGFVNNGKGVFPKLMEHMKMLKKVKMWCAFKAEEKELKDVSTAIQGFILRGSTKQGDRSLSIDVTGCETVQFLESLEAPGKLTKLKLHGKLGNLPEFIKPKEIADTSAATTTNIFVTPLDVRSLCLSLTTLCGSVVPLFAFELQPGATLLPSLRYLKLVENDLGPLKIVSKHFPSLERLCLVGNNSITSITIEAAAYRSLPRFM